MQIPHFRIYKVTTVKLFPKANSTKKITEELLQKRTVQKRLQKSYSKSELYKKRLQKSYSKSELYKSIPHYPIFPLSIFSSTFPLTIFYRLFRFQKNSLALNPYFPLPCRAIISKYYPYLIPEQPAAHLPKTVKSSSLNPSTIILFSLHHDFCHRLTPCTLNLFQTSLLCLSAI